MNAPDANTYPDEWYEDVGEWLATQVADDDGMLEHFVKLEGIKEPRMLSWAAERALRRDLVDGARSVLNGEWRRMRHMGGPYHSAKQVFSGDE